MNATVLVGIAAIVVSVVLTAIGGLLALVVRSNDRRLCDLERNHQANEAHHQDIVGRLHQNEVEVAKLQSLHELRGQIATMQTTLEQLVREVAEVRGTLRPMRHGYLTSPSSPPKRG